MAFSEIYLLDLLHDDVRANLFEAHDGVDQRVTSSILSVISINAVLFCLDFVRNRWSVDEQAPVSPENKSFGEDLAFIAAYDQVSCQLFQ